MARFKEAIFCYQQVDLVLVLPLTGREAVEIITTLDIEMTGYLVFLFGSRDHLSTLSVICQYFGCLPFWGKFSIHTILSTLSVISAAI